MRTAFLAAGTAALSLALLAPGAAQAACQNTYTATTGDWQTDANWSAGSRPTGTQDACVPAGKTVTIIENGIATAKTLTVEAGATLRMRTDPGFASTQASFGDVDNSGTIESTATGAPTDSDVNSFTVVDGAKLTNRGVLRFAQSEGFTAFNGNVTNLAGGSIQINSWTRAQTFGFATTWSNAGTIAVAAGNALDFESAW